MPRSFVWSPRPFPPGKVELRLSAGCPAGRRVLFIPSAELTILIANIGSGMGAQLGAARLLYGMGRSDGIPKKFFGAIDPKNHIPRNNVIFVGASPLSALS